MKLPFRMPFQHPGHNQDENARMAPSSSPADLSLATEGDASPLTPMTTASEPALDPADRPVPAEPSGTASQDKSASADASDTTVLLRVAEEAWRLGRRVDRAAGDVGEAPLADVRDALQRLHDILNEAGVEAVDHDGERYVDGLRLHILHVEGQPADGMPLRVVRTIRPSILADGQVAVSGQVILGPADQEATAP